MCIFSIDDRVRCKDQQGTVIGFFSGDFTIVLLDVPNVRGERGKVIHSADLEKIDDATTTNQRMETF